MTPPHINTTTNRRSQIRLLLYSGAPCCVPPSHKVGKLKKKAPLYHSFFSANASCRACSASSSKRLCSASSDSTNAPNPCSNLCCTVAAERFTVTFKGRGLVMINEIVLLCRAADTSFCLIVVPCNPTRYSNPPTRTPAHLHTGAEILPPEQIQPFGLVRGAEILAGELHYCISHQETIPLAPAALQNLRDENRSAVIGEIDTHFL